MWQVKAEEGREEVCTAFINHFIRKEFKAEAGLNQGCRQGWGRVYSDVPPYVPDLVWTSRVQVPF